MSFGKKLKMLREENNMLQSELAKLLNLGASSISMYEKDERDPDTDTLKRIAEIFNVSTDYLLGLNEERTINEPIEIAANMGDKADLSEMTEKDKQFILDMIERLKGKKD